MRKAAGIIKKYWYYPGGAIIGGIAGYLYWRNVGCASGACPITSSPVMSAIWGALVGGLLLSAIFSNEKRPEAK